MQRAETRGEFKALSFPDQVETVKEDLLNHFWTEDSRAIANSFFELWRNKQMQKQPKASTLQNFVSAWNKVIATAVAHG